MRQEHLVAALALLFPCGVLLTATVPAGGAVPAVAGGAGVPANLPGHPAAGDVPKRTVGVGAWGFDVELFAVPQVGVGEDRDDSAVVGNGIDVEPFPSTPRCLPEGSLGQAAAGCQRLEGGAGGERVTLPGEDLRPCLLYTSRCV